MILSAFYYKLEKYFAVMKYTRNVVPF